MSTARLQRHGLGISWYETDAMARAAHALRDGDHIWLIDPFDDPAALTAVTELGPPAGVIQLLDRHNRDCEALAKGFGVPLHKVPGSLPGTPFEVISVVARPWWKEVALWWAPESTLVVAEAIGTVPLFALGRPAGVHPMLRLTPPRSALGGLAPERLLVGHGPSLDTGGAHALSEALAGARSDVPRLLTALPKVLRGRPQRSA